MSGGNVGLQMPPVVKRRLIKGMEIVNRCSRQSNVQIKTAHCVFLILWLIISPFFQDEDCVGERTGTDPMETFQRGQVS